jgi:hypothetical protein
MPRRKGMKTELTSLHLTLPDLEHVLRCLEVATPEWLEGDEGAEDWTTMHQLVVDTVQMQLDYERQSEAYRARWVNGVLDGGA